MRQYERSAVLMITLSYSIETRGCFVLPLQSPNVACFESRDYRAKDT